MAATPQRTLGLVAAASVLAALAPTGGGRVEVGSIPTFRMRPPALAGEELRAARRRVRESGMSRGQFDRAVAKALSSRKSEQRRIPRRYEAELCRAWGARMSVTDTVRIIERSEFASSPRPTGAGVASNA